MATTRKGLDRITKQELHAQVTTLNEAIDQHCGNCPKCSVAARNVRAHCAIWWQLAIARHIANRKLRQYKEPEHGISDMLPGMDEL